MSIAQEEVFRPVAPVIAAHHKIEAIRAANDSGMVLGQAFGLKPS